MGDIQCPRPGATISQGLLLLPISVPAYQRPPWDPRALPPLLRTEEGAMSTAEAAAAMVWLPWDREVQPAGFSSLQPYKEKPEEFRVLRTAPPQLNLSRAIICMLNFKVSSVPLILCEKTLDSQCSTHVRQQIWFLNRDNHAILTVLAFGPFL